MQLECARVIFRQSLSQTTNELGLKASTWQQNSTAIKRFCNVANLHLSVRHIGYGIDRLKTEFQTACTGKQAYLALHSLQNLQNGLQEDTTDQNLLGTFWHDTT